MAKHTSRPWRFETGKSTLRGCILAKNGEIIARVSQWENDTPKNQAEALGNALLMTAAPELKTSVSDLLGLIERELPHFANTVVCDAARAAISKSEVH